MPTSIPQQITAALVARAQAILIAGGYNTSAGSRVLVARQALDSSDLPCVVVWPAEMSLVERYIGGTRARWTRRYTLEAVALTDPDDAGSVCEWLMADLWQALLGPADPTLGGLVTSIGVEELRAEPRDDGGRTAGASLAVLVEFFAGYGNPYGTE
jgi:hypothetical protein